MHNRSSTGHLPVLPMFLCWICTNRNPAPFTVTPLPTIQVWQNNILLILQAAATAHHVKRTAENIITGCHSTPTKKHTGHYLIINCVLTHFQKNTNTEETNTKQVKSGLCSLIPAIYFAGVILIRPSNQLLLLSPSTLH